MVNSGLFSVRSTMCCVRVLLKLSSLCIRLWCLLVLSGLIFRVELFFRLVKCLSNFVFCICLVSRLL